MTKSEAIKHKIFEPAALMHKIGMWRFLNKKIIFTNGCFDVLHHGHVYLLNKAADCERQGVLIVGLNSDASVKKLKGESRPINNYNDRAILIASLYATDAVIEFNDDTPVELIKMIQPDILVKGGDYKEDAVVGAEFVKSKGGKVVIVPYLQNYSTTNIISRLAD